MARQCCQMTSESKGHLVPEPAISLLLALYNYVFNLGGQCPPALPVADPMLHIYVCTPTVSFGQKPSAQVYDCTRRTPARWASGWKKQLTRLHIHDILYCTWNPLSNATDTDSTNSFVNQDNNYWALQRECEHTVPEIEHVNREIFK